MSVMLVNITGPDGTQVEAGQPVPASWDADYVKALVKSGGAGTQKAWDERVARNAVEAEARREEPPLPSWGQAEQQEHREYEALQAQLAAIAALGVDISGVEVPPPPPPPPQVPDKVREAARALLDATEAEVEAQAKKLSQAVAKECKPTAGLAAVAKARHDLAGTVGGDAK